MAMHPPQRPSGYQDPSVIKRGSGGMQWITGSCAVRGHAVGTDVGGSSDCHMGTGGPICFALCSVWYPSHIHACIWLASTEWFALYMGMSSSCSIMHAGKCISMSMECIRLRKRE